MNDLNRIIYIRGNGFLTESGNWSNDIVEAALFDETSAKVKREQLIIDSDKVYNPVILMWN